MRAIQDVRVRRVPSRNMIPVGATGIFVIEDEDDQVVLRI